MECLKPHLEARKARNYQVDNTKLEASVIQKILKTTIFVGYNILFNHFYSLSSESSKKTSTKMS